MGLDQYVFMVERHEDNTDFMYSEDADTFELAYRRKHPNLEGWMEDLFNSKANAQGFEGDKRFPTEVVAHMVGVVDKSEVTPEMLEMVTPEEAMKAIIRQEQYASMAANLHKSRIFNNQPLRLNVGDLDQLEMHVRLGTLPSTSGFFFGENSDSYYYNEDLELILEAREAINKGHDVYYVSSW